MKKNIITCIFTFVLAQGHAQDTLRSLAAPTPGPAKNHPNELGLDVTPFLKFYLDFSYNGGYNYQPSYMLTYRRYFKKSSFRAAIGGNYIYSESPSPFNGDSLKIRNYNRSSAFVFRVGYEFFQELSRRWQVYYGADLATEYSHQRNDALISGGGYFHGQENAVKGIGIAPLLGIRFRLTPRMSLITESRFLVQYSETTSQRYYTPISRAYPPKKSDPRRTIKTTGTTFYYPLSIILTFSF
jgi:hypothetical protein